MTIGIDAIPDDGLPLILLDVDGVINTFSGFPPGHFRTGDARPEPDDRAYRITWDPEVIERLTTIINDGAAHVLWLTTWGSGANGELRELVELPELVVAEESPQIRGYKEHEDDYGDDWWKLAAVKRITDRFPGRKIVWIDDDIPIEKKAIVHASEHEILTISPSTWKGLQMSDFDRIKRYLRNI